MFQIEQISILVITIALGVAFWLISKQFRDFGRKDKPNRLVAAVIAFVQWLNEYTISAMGRHYGPKFSAYIGSIFIFILVSNLSGLVGLQPPTANFSVTLALTLITWIGIQVISIKTNGIKGYLAGFAEPFAFFIIPNIFGQLAPLVSLSVRLFGNVIAGATIMSMLYSFTAWASSFIPIIGNFNFIGVGIGSILHLYFDVFSGFLQAFIFISLTIIFIGVETPQEDH